MKKTLSNLPRLAKAAALPFLVFVLLGSLPASAFDDPRSGAAVASGTVTSGSLRGTDSPGISTEEFGLSTANELWIPAADFRPLGGGVLQYDTAYYWINTSAAGNQFGATLELPQGALIDGYRVFYFDASVTNNITVQLDKSRDDITSVNPPDWILVGTTFQSIGAVGFATAYVTLNHTVDLREGPDTTAKADAASFYTFVVTVPNDPAVKFKGLRVTWFRQISPPPSTATFLDVPVSHGFFQEIEALASSGITAGCGGGNFCPDSPVTRSQMAAFLSRALGLHWKPF